MKEDKMAIRFTASLIFLLTAVSGCDTSDPDKTTSDHHAVNSNGMIQDTIFRDPIFDNGFDDALVDSLEKARIKDPVLEEWQEKKVHIMNLDFDFGSPRSVWNVCQASDSGYSARMHLKKGNVVLGGQSVTTFVYDSDSICKIKFKEFYGWVKQKGMGGCDFFNCGGAVFRTQNRLYVMSLVTDLCGSNFPFKDFQALISKRLFKRNANFIVLRSNSASACELEPVTQ
jgi:hypothetical protein